jgi:cystathionine gamma-synthase
MAKGISVLLPTWEDVVGWTNRNPKVLAYMRTGYPRFFIPRVVDDLATQLLHRAPLFTRGEQDVGSDCSTTSSAGHDRLALLFPCCRDAEQCRDFLLRVGVVAKSQIQIFSADMTNPRLSLGAPKPSGDANEEVYAVAYPENLFPQAKSFWQHTGRGISSRFATHWFENAQFLGPSLPRLISSHIQLPIEEADDAKVVLRKRIAALSSTDIVHVSPEDVYLYPTGMSSICDTADVVQKLDLKCSAVRKVAVFG